MSFPAGKVAVHLPHLKSAPVTGGLSPIAGTPSTGSFSAAATSKDDEDITDSEIFLIIAHVKLLMIVIYVSSSLLSYKSQTHLSATTTSTR